MEVIGGVEVCRTTRTRGGCWTEERSGTALRWAECVKSDGRSAGVREAAFEVAHEGLGGGVGGDALAGAPAGVHDRCMVAPAEATADRRQRRARMLAREVHRDLPRPREARVARGRQQLV